MRVTIGIESAPCDQSNAVDNLDKLSLTGLSHVSLVCVVDTMSKLDRLIGVEAILENISSSQLQTRQLESAKQSLLNATIDAKKRNFNFDTCIKKGPIANTLMDFITEDRSNLLVLGPENRKNPNEMRIGGITRKCMVNSPISVLVSKMPFTSPLIRAVIATDHSDYADRCLQILIEFSPQGFRELIVTTIYSLEDVQNLVDENNCDAEEAVRAIEKNLNKLNQSVINRLSKLNCELSSRIEMGHTSAGLKEVMLKERADLLIMGAQGHGFAERLVMGSVSLDLVMSEPKSILVMRA